MRWPGRIAAGTSDGSLVRITDIAPTVADMLGAALPERIDGRSLRAALEGGELPPSVALIENMHFAEERLGLRTPTHKYVRWEIGKEEVYDLRSDPAEQVDLAGNGEVLAPLRAMVDELVSAARPEASSKPVAPSGATVEALRALGYVK
jgi:arylsulfatase A-like enzyme